LFDDAKLCIPICSYECKNRYLDSLSEKEEVSLLRRLDERIEKAKSNLKMSWAAAGAGVLTLVISLLARNVTIFLSGAFVATTSAFLTRHFEGEIVSVKQNRMSVSTRT
jgi:hypothetical protein